MRNYIFILACVLAVSCKSDIEACCPDNPLVDSTAAPSASTPDQDSLVVRITQSLQSSESIGNDIKTIIQDKVALQAANDKLTVDLSTTKDSLKKVSYELRETRLKVPKKRNFLQRLVGVARDSVEVIKVDSVQLK